jgi:hypothetical protein
MDILAALRRTVELVESSERSGWANEAIERTAQRLRTAIAALESGAPVDRADLGVLFAPTGAIQETSIDNGWGDECLTLSEIVDGFLATRDRDA